MAEQTEKRKTFKIIRDGRFYKVYNEKHLFPSVFTTYRLAEQFIDRLLTVREEQEFRAAVHEIKKMKNINKKMKEYKKLCQEHSKQQ